jgi:predicted GNAT family acetyltransferase
MSVTITHVPDEQRYEARVDDERAGFLAYRRSDGLVVLAETQVDAAYEGRGIGGTLARAALDDARREHLRVQPRCPFVRRWIERHPDYADLVAEAPPTEG